MHGIEKDCDLEAIEGKYLGICDFKRLGQSSVVKITFNSESLMKYYLCYGLNIGYEYFLITADRKLPRRCQRCQSMSHDTKKCQSRAMKCARCSGDHEISRDKPCSLPVQCVNCG
jgi:hypothetical protein